MASSNGDKAQLPTALPADGAGNLLHALQRAESELAATRAALERKTQELARALAAQKEIEVELHQQRDWRDAGQPALNL